MVNKTGGKVIASGGFGCVFRPALKCKGHATRSKNKISKLMIKKYALKEYDDIKKYKFILEKIPNYPNYFLIDGFHLCDPEKLNEEDLFQFKKKCTALPKNKITEQNINQNLDKLSILNIPDGGLPLDDFIDENIKYNVFIEINNKLLELLTYGIIPMNKKYIFHSDIKDSNILVEKKNQNLFIRLIDWGLSAYYIPFKNNGIPKTWRNRPLQFNVPFSNILFTTDFYEKYTKLLNDNNKQIDQLILKPFVLDYLYFWLKERGPGHYKFINKIMYQLFSNSLKNIDESLKETLIETDFTVSYITNYIVQVLLNYTNYDKRGAFTLQKYIDEVYIKIIDIYGLVTSYYPFLNLYFDNYKNLSLDEKEIFERLKEIFVTYLYSPRITPINIEMLKAELLSLNNLFKQANTINNSNQKSFISTISSKNSMKKTSIIKKKQKTKKIPLLLSKHKSFKNKY